MRIVHLLLPGASDYDRKSQRIDSEGLRREHEVVLAADVREIPSADVAQIYGPAVRLPKLSMPYIASAHPPRRFGLRRRSEPAFVVSPVKKEGFEYLPEAVEEPWLAPPAAGELHSPGARYTVGSFARPSMMRMVEQAVPRLHRTHEDIEWLLLDRPPSPSDLDPFDVWVDPAADEEDFDGFVAEGLARGKPVVASRTAINAQRLEKGRTGFLVPPGDANELVHAILAALFKPEVAQQRTEAARQTISKFFPRQRLRVLLHMLETARS